MNTKTTLLLTAALLASPALKAQQNPQPAQPAPPASAQPCPATTPKPPSVLGKQFHFHWPASVQGIIDTNRRKIENTTGIQVPSITPGDILKQPQKPCTPARPVQPVAASPKQPNIQLPPTTPSRPWFK